ncbi:hypothetical protein [Paludisphaera rhizosphaerae]|uniref:hypothetical protein n=1 Tax=Paludisphaera rhizosphaerae TaxID=2711216 RepID=UPI0013ED2893|nr:hypothetical protein [Paludisphaera rhizosphaerae]
MLTPLPTKRWKRSPAEAAPAALRPDDATQEFVPASADSDHIAELLRHTTFRAHDALKAAQTNPQTLRTIRAEVVGLEREIERLGLRALRPFLNSLRRKLEESL